MCRELAGRFLEAVDVEIAVTEAAVGLVEFGKRCGFACRRSATALSNMAFALAAAVSERVFPPTRRHACSDRFISFPHS
jgi:hypothetical protein